MARLSNRFDNVMGIKMMLTVWQLKFLMFLCSYTRDLADW